MPYNYILEFATENFDEIADNDEIDGNNQSGKQIKGFFYYIIENFLLRSGEKYHFYLQSSTSPEQLHG